MSFSEPSVCSGILGAVEHLEQSRLVGMKSCEQAVEGDEVGFAGEDAIEFGFQMGLVLRRTVGLEIAVELPPMRRAGGLGSAVLIREGVELVNQALGMNPAMLADLELSGVVADDHLAQEAVALDAAPQRAFGCDQRRVQIDLEGGDAELFQMRGPCRLIGEVTIGLFAEQGDHMRRQRPFAHIGERCVIDDVIATTGAEQAEEVEAALGGGGGEGGEMSVRNLARFLVKAIMPCGQQADQLAFGDVEATRATEPATAAPWFVPDGIGRARNGAVAARNGHRQSEILQRNERLRREAEPLIHGLDCIKAMPTLVAGRVLRFHPSGWSQPTMATNPPSTLQKQFAWARLSRPCLPGSLSRRFRPWTAVGNRDSRPPQKGDDKVVEPLDIGAAFCWRWPHSWGLLFEFVFSSLGETTGDSCRGPAAE
jgi:hypothetical protein